MSQESQNEIRPFIERTSETDEVIRKAETLPPIEPVSVSDNGHGPEIEQLRHDLANHEESKQEETPAVIGQNPSEKDEARTDYIKDAEDIIKGKIDPCAAEKELQRIRADYIKEEFGKDIVKG
ncbi:MAG: hypothetical protein WDA09_04900 [Bacteriovoracaceae bacterium]